MTADSPTLKGWNSKIAIYGCRRCHRLGGAGNLLAADLDFSVRKKSPEELAEAIMRPVKAMPNFSFTEATVTETVTALLAASARNREAQSATGQVVHFESSGGETEDIFTEKCVGCHRALTSKNGSLGRGDTAPNLSGLFSSYYPGSYAKGERWSKERVEKWLRNPRQVRQNARMQPVEVTTDEIRSLIKILQIE